jgi:hypothetical protein
MVTSLARRTSAKRLFCVPLGDFLAFFVGEPVDEVRVHHQFRIVKEVRVDAEHGWIAFLDTEGFWHGVYDPDEYLGVGE